ncbi:MAG: 4Fe-4S dicluster domain-containing protein [Desulfobacteraceae bacterium]|jgi:dissimilatory sulfite reductase (desulfoviridin) alpha/beta subunit|nr:4Fe-4S dicluster domain-containing protein [Desulfobacteraceae bacterium]
MKWTQEADDTLKKVPFFVRKKVRARVEKETRETGKQVVTLADVKATQARYLQNMSSEIKGYQLDTCFGPSGCPNRAVISDGLLLKIEDLLQKEDLLGFLKANVRGDLKFHHEFRITLADCPNACSQPQIKDIGIIGACAPRLTEELCTLCGGCVEACKENAITLDTAKESPQIKMDSCLCCGKCMPACPTGTIAEGSKGYRVQLGGKLGRHPRLAKELPGIYSEEQVVLIVKTCLQFYKQTSKQGERFGQILTPVDFDQIAERFQG